MMWCAVLPMMVMWSVATQAESLLELRFDGKREDVAIDTSGNGRNARITATSRTAGRTGLGMAFDHPQDHLSVPFNDALSLTDGPFTISCWFKPNVDGYTRAGTYELLGTAADRGPGWRLYITWAKIVFRSGEGYGDGKSFWQVGTDPTRDEIFADQWNHVAVTRNDQDTVRVYLNGRLCGHSEQPFVVTPVRRDLTIGSYHSGRAYPYVGVLDEVSITNRALSARQVFEHAVLGR